MPNFAAIGQTIAKIYDDLYDFNMAAVRGPPSWISDFYPST